MKLHQNEMTGLTALLLATIFSACSQGYTPASFTAATDNNQSKANVSVNQGIDVEPATSAQCASSGGSVFSVYLDANANGIKDATETVVSSQVICNGAVGASGANGSNGVNGAVGATGATGATGAAGADGANGTNGSNGTNGTNGTNGSGIAFKTYAAPVATCPAGGSVLVVAVDIDNNGVYNASAPNQQMMTVCNGSNGQDAVTPAYAAVEPIMPCGNTVAYKEVLLRLANGQVLASFSNDASGAMTRLAFLPDGSFLDTDNSNCSFSLSTSSDGGTRSISWFGVIQKSWNLTAP